MLKRNKKYIKKKKKELTKPNIWNPGTQLNRVGSGIEF